MKFLAPNQRFAGGLDSFLPQAKIQARYDNATDTRESWRSFWNADYFSAKSANSFQVRRTLRIKSRYEVSNNPFLWGITNNHADDLVDTGPTLQVVGRPKSEVRQIEYAWREWCDEVDFAEKLRTLTLARTVDGEGFLVLKTAPSLENPVKLYPVDLEADQVTTPQPTNLEQLWIDGLTLDPITQRPVTYQVLKHHPGDFFFPSLNPLEVATVPKKWVCHFFPKFRPGQVRGVPIFTPSLDLFSDLRAFRKAVLGAANLAADLAAVLESEAPAFVFGSSPPSCEAGQRFRIDRGMMATLPAGYKMNAFRPEQPTTTYQMFQEAALGEAVRPLSYPLNLALGTSQRFNFSSAKLDHLNYRSTLDKGRNQLRRAAVEICFVAFVFEAARIRRLLPPDIRSARDIRREWHWPGYMPLDEAVEAEADHARLSNGTLTAKQFWASRGCDWREMYQQLAEESEERRQLKIELGEPAKKTIREDGDEDGSSPEATA